MKNWLKWIIFILGIGLAVYLIKTNILNTIIPELGSFGILGILISGFFFAYGFTAAPATISLIYFTNSFNFLIISFIGAIGTMLGDFLFFSIIKNDLPDEIERFLQKSFVKKLKKSKFRHFIPVIAAFFIASPLPDEIGISLLGITKYDNKKFMIISFILNFIGILIITGIASLF